MCAHWRRDCKIEALKKAELIARLLEEKKAEDLVLLEMKHITDFCDFFVIGSASSHRQVQALAQEIEENMGARKIKPHRVQRDRDYSWVVLDFLDVVVHIFYSETRQFYNLERLWLDAKRIDFAKLK